MMLDFRIAMLGLVWLRFKSFEKIERLCYSWISFFIRLSGFCSYRTGDSLYSSHA